MPEWEKLSLPAFSKGGCAQPWRPVSSADHGPPATLPTSSAIGTSGLSATSDSQTCTKPAQERTIVRLNVHPNSLIFAPARTGVMEADTWTIHLRRCRIGLR